MKTYRDARFRCFPNGELHFRTLGRTDVGEWFYRSDYDYTPLSEIILILRHRGFIKGNFHGWFSVNVTRIGWFHPTSIVGNQLFNALRDAVPGPIVALTSTPEYSNVEDGTVHFILLPTEEDAVFAKMTFDALELT